MWVGLWFAASLGAAGLHAGERSVGERSFMAPLASEALVREPPAQELPAQEPPPPQRTTLSGRLWVGEEPADSGTVVLHAVNPEEAGPVDSVRVDPDGRFAFDLTDVPSPGQGQSILATHRRDGVLYFGSPVVSIDAIPDEYEVRAYPSRVVPAGGLPVSIETRTLIIEDGPGVWQVTDVIRLHNDSTVAWVADPAGDGVVWRYPLPPQAETPGLMDPGTGVERVTFADGTLVVNGAVPPGDRVFVVRYGLPSLATSIPLAGRTDVIEIMVSDAAPALDVPGLVRGEPLEMDGGNRYRRWTAEDVGDRVVRITLDPGADGGGMPAGAWAGVIAALLLIVAGVWLVRGSPDPPQDTTPDAP